MSRCTFSSDDIVVKSPNDRRLYRFIQLENGLSALLVHDPEIYPDGCPKLSESVEHSDEEDEECEDEEEEGEEGEDSEGEDGDDDEEDEDEVGEEEGDEGTDNEEKGKGNKAAVQTKKVGGSFTWDDCGFFYFFF